jgi:hypothetical protein
MLQSVDIFINIHNTNQINNEVIKIFNRYTKHKRIKRFIIWEKCYYMGKMLLYGKNVI